MRRKVVIVIVIGLLAVETAVVAQRRGRLLAVDTVVECRRNHLFTTYWIPGVSIKSVRLGWWRLQRCPVGAHWDLVTPVDVETLDAQELELAAAVHDARVP